MGCRRKGVGSGREGMTVGEMQREGYVRWEVGRGWQVGEKGGETRGQWGGKLEREV